jgi:hypothetical protein
MYLLFIWDRDGEGGAFEHLIKRNWRKNFINLQVADRTPKMSRGFTTPRGLEAEV